ncbi:tyrosine-protein phosphatase non-receptor type substrate 1-like [Platysternon megacephalum]|uniref:Tyrosine-protein phosphatase non-receptor type substrate 1-like n=1 Tax=Platysternon megacephalum TaxID=55544 RepID=A0A4D9EF62_9SAUR|nr:tyrosine-protein phosphatase non-receptor type substrate 1-like [Platysternon megacephalum]
MAWPCISRVCCLARFWSQLDKSDLSVPLTIHSYSDIEEPEEGASPARGGPRRGAAADGRSRAGGGQLPAGAPPSQDSLAIKRSWKGGSHKRGPAAAPPGSQPFAAETQYRQDFRAWPLQKRDAYPWAGEGRRDGPPAPARSVYVLPAGDSDQRPEASSRLSCSPPGAANTTSYRQEYRPWTGAKPSKPIKTKQGFIIPEDHFVQETSYRADFKIPEAKTKFSPNPSAVFQAPSRILNV